MRYFSLFSGVGGFELGIEKAYASMVNRHATSTDKQEPSEILRRSDVQPDGQLLQGTPTCVGFSEIDKHASAVLKYRFPNIKNYGDITKIDWSLVPDFDLLVGGSPCQDLSIAGKRAGLEGGRSGLFYEYVRCLEEKKPEHFIWENVKGALSSNQGRDFGAVLSALAEAGYSLWWQVLNAKDFGVPQNRERVFVVGTRSGSPREVFFERGDDEEALGVDWPLKQGAQSVATRHLGRNGSLTAPHAGAVQVAETPHVVTLTPPGTSDAFRVYGTDGVNKTLAANGGGTGAKTGLIASIQRCGDRDKNTVSTIPVAHTLAANPMSDYLPKVTDFDRIRRLTPIECERLMSWPDSWTKFGDYGDGPKEISDTQRYKMCGNGVVSDVVVAVVEAHLL